MRPISLLVLLPVVLAACGELNPLPRPSIENKPDTVSLYALHGTPVSSPSGYSLQFVAVVRPDQSSAFDFVFDVDSTGRPVLLTTGALKLGRASGIQLTTTPFDSVKIAPSGGYNLDSAIVVDSNSVAILHSVPTTCVFANSQFVYYAKLQVLAIDTSSAPNGRRIDLVILTDQNCGYRGLEPGLPRR